MGKKTGKDMNIKIEQTAQQANELDSAIKSCCKNVDSVRIAAMIDAGKFLWTDWLTGETFVPNNREIKRELYELGSWCLKEIMKGERDEVVASNRQLFFKIWIIGKNMFMTCGYVTATVLKALKRTEKGVFVQREDDVLNKE